ncbi:hypothetical protein VNO77_39851 [Canavalia gladiata]|uniref:CASP-like protein n=1 Tax=Canavalia gladiata TaxID=3824 RepID=A0AAN9JX94_CANGL
MNGWQEKLIMIRMIMALIMMMSLHTCAIWREACVNVLCKSDSKREREKFEVGNKMKGDSIEGGEVSKGASPKKGVRRGLSIMDFILRIIGGVATLGSALAMGTTNESLPFATQFIRFRAEFDDLPTLVFFVMANSVVCGYLVLSLLLSVFHIVRSTAVKSRILLIALDTVMMGLLTGAASAAASIVYIAHYGNPNANWFSICQQYNNFCERISGSLIGSFIVVPLFIILILLSATAISRN